MKSLFQFVAPPSQCGYLPAQSWSLEYEQFEQLTPAEYLKRLTQGWRRFGGLLFRPRCVSCRACQSLRVVVERFRPNRSQRRARKANEGIVRISKGEPRVTRTKLDLYDRYHAFQTENKGWPWHEPKDAHEYALSFVENPFPTQEWCFFMEDRLIGVGYVDHLPGALSAIYFFYDPEERDRSLGTWNVLSIIEHAAERRIPHVYLGYFVEGCPSLAYKATFAPNEVLGPDRRWHEFRS